MFKRMIPSAEQNYIMWEALKCIYTSSYTDYTAGRDSNDEVWEGFKFKSL